MGAENGTCYKKLNIISSAGKCNKTRKISVRRNNKIIVVLQSFPALIPQKLL